MWITITTELIPYKEEELVNADKDNIIYEHVYDTGVGPTSTISLSPVINVNTLVTTIPKYLVFRYKEQDGRVIATSKNYNSVDNLHITKKVVKKCVESKYDTLLFNTNVNGLKITDTYIVYIDRLYSYNDMIKAFKENIPEWVSEDIAMIRFAHFLKGLK